MKELLKEFKNKIEKIEVTYDYDQTYTDLLNACIDFQNETQCWEFESIFDEIVDYELAEERAKYELENNGLIRLYYFLGDTIIYGNEVFRINAYGNLENINKDDLENLKQEILDKIEELLENKESEE